MWKFVLLILQALPLMGNLAHFPAFPQPFYPSLSLSQFSSTEPGSDEKGCFELSKNNTLLFSDVLHSFGKSKNEYLVDTRSYSFLFKVKKKKVIVKYIDGTNIDGISGEKKKYYGTYKLNYRYYS